MYKFIPDEADRPAGEPRQAGPATGLIAPHHLLDHGQAVRTGGRPPPASASALHGETPATLPFSITSTRRPDWRMTARGLQPTKE